VPLLALVLALLVFVPDVALAGSWASPAPPIVNVENVPDAAAVAPAELVAPSTQDPITPAQAVVLIVVAFCWGLRQLADALPLWGAVWEPPQPPGRRGRPLLQAYLN
jgi:hypothetical protein